jgi:hypothetical protein
VLVGELDADLVELHERLQAVQGCGAQWVLGELVAERFFLAVELLDALGRRAQLLLERLRFLVVFRQVVDFAEVVELFYLLRVVLELFDESFSLKLKFERKL